MTNRVRRTVAGAIVDWLAAQRIEIEGQQQPLFPGVFAIFGHGNVTCLGQALEEARDRLPTWRGQNEQGMALAAIAYAKARRRRQIMAATSSIGPGALNMVTAAGVAMANRLPVLLLAGDTFASRVPDPVLQQIEIPGCPSTTVNDAFRPVVRFWDRIIRPEQLLSSLPQALRIMLDPAECGPAFIGLPQDVQEVVWDFPCAFFAPTLHHIARPRPDLEQVKRVAAALRDARRPLVIAGGGVRYSEAEAELKSLAHRHALPVAETMAGRSSMLASDPSWVGPIGITGWEATDDLAREADVVLAVGTRLQDFTTASWTVFGSEGTRLLGINVSGLDAAKHAEEVLVGDALACLEELARVLGSWRAPADWSERTAVARARGRSELEERTAATAVEGTPSYAQVVGAVQRAAGATDRVLTAAGGFPGELNANWLGLGPNTFDCEYGFSCMGYEISGGWGSAMAAAGAHDVFCLVGDGAYLMMNSDLYSSVLSGHPMIVVVCDNGGFAIIDRLQRNQGGASFNNMLSDVRGPGEVRVDFEAHARALGCAAETVDSVAGLERALAGARHPDRTHVIVIRTDANTWSESQAFWDLGVPRQSGRASVREAAEQLDHGRKGQWLA